MMKSNEIRELVIIELEIVAGGGKNEASIVFAKAGYNGADVWNQFVGCAGLSSLAVGGFQQITGGGCPK
ncbi:hypothetical protein SAMN05216330_12713 [Bradyrhizobium sp. Ghvi]|uniref:hypothetical protein n=1 Tax=Bradyrhizobium sp. Ghvi TaxID=1855319 RepID=UPI0008F3024A|nr:hypothetical protein [Bradyrhizobium sp. Ghvi]SFQ32903.1 hypothetical protein SAMN05216330_12713 [Bradyrhizobium sp. Ghvi]